MKFKVGDQVLVTGGKDKGKKSSIVRVIPDRNRVVVEGVNMYVKHVRSQGERPGEKVKRERPLPLANIAIINDKGQADRIGYKVMKNGDKVRIFRKTNKEVPEKKVEKKTKNKK